MIKKILIILGVIILAIVIYYGRYFFFDTEVNETAPEIVSLPGETTPTLRVGSFTEVDAIHKGEGNAVLVENGDDKFIRFENFKVTNGPDLYVWLTKSDQPTSKIESLGEYIDLGKLKGNVGDQNYTITQDIEDYDTVVVWCRQFSQLFTYANLK